MTATDTDYTGKMGPLQSDRDWPMYSYERPAWLFWNAFANQLAREGFSADEIKEALQGRGVRKMLDTEEEEIEEVGRTLAHVYHKAIREAIMGDR